MALIESLKAFYKDNVENVDKLNNADSVLEVLRAKYGNYKGSNIEEYFKELVNNGISPGGGGGGGATFPTFTHDAETGSWSCDKTYNECLEMCENSPTSPSGPSYPCLLVSGSYTAFQVMTTVEDTGILIYTFESTLTYHSDGTITEERA